LPVYRWNRRSCALEYRRKEVAKDDVLDALAAAITAKMGCRYGFEYVSCEPETENKGLKIQMVYCIPKSNSKLI